MTMLLPLLALSVAFEAKPWTGCFTVEIEQNAGFPKQSFPIERGRHGLPGTPSDVADTNGYRGSASLPDNKRHILFSFEIKSTILESISWQWLYAANMLVAYNRILTSRPPPPGTTLFSWLASEAFVAVSLLLKSFWNPDSLLFKKSEQQSASALTEGKHRFATIIIMFGSGCDPQQYQPSEPPGQQAPQATIQPTGYLTHQLYCYSDDGDGDPQQDSHTLGLNCFVYPCRGVCQFRPSSDSGSSAEWPLNSAESSIDDIEATSEQNSSPHLADEHYLSCTGHFDPLNTSHCQPDSSLGMLAALSDIEFPFKSGPLFDQQPYDIDDKPDNSINSTNIMNEALFCTTDAIGPLNDEEPSLRNLSSITLEYPAINGSFNPRTLLEEAGFSFTLSDFPLPVETSETQPTTIELSQLSCGPPHLYRTGAACALSDHESRAHTEQISCDVTVTVMDGQPQPCRKVFRNARSLSAHRSKYHSGQKHCDLTVIEVDGEQRPCRTVCKNAQSLSRHKSERHTEQRTCVAIVVGEDGQPRPCRTFCKTAQALSTHKSRYHSGQKTCNAKRVAENGQLQPCGMVLKNNRALFDHKNRVHSEPQTCNLTVTGEDGQPRPCGKICKHARALLDHKKRKHTGQQTCDVTMVRDDGQQQLCGKVYQGIRALSAHKSRVHSEQRTCVLTVPGDDGPPRPCGKICNNAQSLSNHKRRNHRMQKACSTSPVQKGSLQSSCEILCKNATSLEKHKREHLKRKHVDVDRDEDEP
ncbi:hypothetical protein [Endozoicomonas sp. 8E]|uniref:hypothetical protein n=1 Tax=Endozoicomonas sp. 8E TaxID=3035692 RepID=UPI0029394A18|nr:hypothetical protein [Endozoicomonas sp. 8E]WOG27093.1 hypothetical protein P6910_21460 [Endozoicomonas sp. 8E]